MRSGDMYEPRKPMDHAEGAVIGYRELSPLDISPSYDSTIYVRMEGLVLGAAV